MTVMKGLLLTFYEVREIQKNLLFSFADFCESHCLRYSLGGGTLLGAVRHQGFIPWDDDVDVMMPRPDYEVLLKEFNHKHYFLSHYYASGQHLFPFAKMYDTRTFTHPGSNSTSVFIDIFPIDAVVDRVDFFYKWHVEQQYLRITDAYRFFILRRSNDNWLRRMIGCLLWGRTLIKNRSSIWFKERAKFHHSALCKDTFGNTQLAGAITGIYGEKEIMPTKTFLEYVSLPFEGRMMSCIKDYDTYLTLHYGDYMQLPPQNKQIGGHQHDYYWK